MWLWWVLACSGDRDPIVPESWSATKIAQTRGLSGLARDPDGTLWAVGERDATLRTLDGQKALPIEGIPEGLDTESVAFLGPNRVVFGTESMDPDRTSETLLVGQVESDRVLVVERWALPTRVLGAPAEANRGLEAVCTTPVGLVAATEVVIQKDGSRWAPIAWRPLSGGTWTRGRVRLSTETGKLAGLACSGDQIYAIERHYGIAVLLNFSLTGSAIEPRAAPLHPLIGGTLPNLEGLEVFDSTVVLISDNDSGGLSGPTWRFDLPLEGLYSSAEAAAGASP